MVYVPAHVIMIVRSGTLARRSVSVAQARTLLSAGLVDVSEYKYHFVQFQIANSQGIA